MSAVRAGTTLGRYRLEELLSRGGMGEVWRAHDSTLGRPVAVKLLHAGVTEAGDRERFVREARAAAQLSHRNVVAVFDVGEWSGRPFLVMELLDGRTLAAILAARGPLPPDDVRDLGAQAAAGLHAAHQAGVVHRDVKPSNLVRTQDGSLKVVDFGIARVLDEASTRLTRTGTIVGTASYLAPEQVRGRSADARSDLYALGCVLYQLLTGRTPFVGGSTEVVYGHLHTAPTPPSRLRPGVPEDLDELVLSLLAKEPADRPADAAAVRAALLATRSTSTRSTGWATPDPAEAATALSPAMAAASGPLWASAGHPGIEEPVGTARSSDQATRTFALPELEREGAVAGQDLGGRDTGAGNDRSARPAPRPRPRSGDLAVLVAAAALAVALLSASLWVWKNTAQSGGAQVAGDRPPAPSATTHRSPSPRQTTTQTPKATSAPRPSTRVADSSNSGDAGTPAVGSPAWLNRLDAALAFLSSTGRVDPEVADRLRNSVDKARQAYADGDPEKARERMQKLRRDFAKAYSKDDLPTGGTLDSILGAGWQGEQGPADGEANQTGTGHDGHGHDRGNYGHGNDN
ncbi:serine/threonine-protein kinase [Actinopolymorpha singaporensis]|uniref:non-specific serine/threonine protein kinase n=1 Tax=Actinopolymorpha singaporensis TaxID=117157 RepID=A0A1H1W2C5_9ACTN|nr:serine/threonine-protein kinase [Actinopolymorpha singaporensis]SDS90656.1 serine/threonine protein kinase [Actinopolymorpha singaporensis]